MNETSAKTVSRRAAWSRSLIGLLLALPLAVLVAGIFACLPVPIGDPEKSKVDEKLVGGWIVANEDKSSTIYIVRAFDQRTYMIQGLDFEVAADKSIKPKSTMTFKAWLTPIGKETFICVETLNPETPLGIADKGEKQTFLVAAISLKDDELTMRVVKPDSPQLKDVKTTADADKALAAHVGELEMYSDPTVFKKLGKNDAETVQAVLKAFQISGK